MPHSRTLKTLVLASGRFLTACVGLIIAAILTRLLSKHDYATYRQTLLAYLFISPLLTIALPQALYYFLPGEEKRPRAILVENLTLLTAMGSVFSLVLLLGGIRFLAWQFDNPDLVLSLLILIPYPLFMLPASSLDACLMAQIETISAIAPHAKYAVASEEVEPALGWAYAGFLHTLTQDPAGLTGAEFATAVVDSYITHDFRIVDDAARQAFVYEVFGYEGQTTAQEVVEGLGRDITISAIDLSKMSDLNAAFNNFIL